MKRAILLAAAMALALPGCSLLRRHRSVPQEPVSVHVENQNFNDATIYAITQGAPVRLGNVTGHSHADFVLPHGSREVSFHIHLLASSNYQTETLSVFPGDRLELVIAPDLGTTRLIRRS